MSFFEFVIIGIVVCALAIVGWYVFWAAVFFGTIFFIPYMIYLYGFWPVAGWVVVVAVAYQVLKRIILTIKEPHSPDSG